MRWLTVRRSESATSPVAMTRAAALDGLHVCVTLAPPEPGAIVAIDRASGERTTLSAAVAVGAQTVLLSAAELPGEDERTFDLVFVGASGERALVHDGPTNIPTRPPPTPDGRWRHRVRPTKDGLELQRTAEPATVAVTGFALTGGRIEISWPAGEGNELVITDADAAPLVTIDAEVRGDVATAALGADLQLPVEASLDVAVGSGDRRRPLSRSRNDLRAPKAAVVLPDVRDARHELRLRWSPGGRLQVRRRRAE